MITAAFMVPHPPLIVREVGRGSEKQVQKTIDSYIEELLAEDNEAEMFLTDQPYSVSFHGRLGDPSTPSCSSDAW